MSIEVDRLSLRIVSEGSEASSALEGLASSLDKLANHSRSIKTLSSGLTTLGKALEGFHKEQAERLSSIAASLERMGGVKLPALGSFTRDLRAVQRINLDGVAEKLGAISEAAGALNQETGSGNLSQFMSSLASVSRHAGRASQVTKQAAEAATEFSGPAASGGDVKPHTDEAVQSAGRLKGAYAGVLEAINRFSGKRINQLRRDTLDASGAARQLRLGHIRVLEAIQGYTSGKLDRLSQDTQSAARAANGLKAGYQGGAGTLWHAARLFHTLGDAARKLPSLFASASKGLKKLPAALSAAIHPLRTLRSLLGKVSGTMGGMAGGFGRASTGARRFGLSLLASFGKLLKFRIMRVILTDIFNGVTTGIKNLYQYGDLFAGTMDRLSTETLYLKNSIAAALSPALNALVPVIECVVDAFVDFINGINLAIAAMTGADTWTKAVKYPKAYSDSLGDAAGSAKELRNTLLSFDEINRLDVQSGGSGTDSASGSDGSSMFTTEAVALNSHPFIQTLKDMIEEIKREAAAGDWPGVGQALADGFGSAVDYLDQHIASPGLVGKVQSAVDKATGVIEGFFQQLTFSDGTKQSIAGRTGGLVGDALTLAMNTIHRYLSGVSWGNVGIAAAQFLNGALQKLNTNDVNFGSILADLLNRGVRIIWNFSKAVEWKEVGQFIGHNVNSFFQDTEWSEIGKGASLLISGFAEMLTAAIQEINTETVENAFIDFFGSLDYVRIVQSIRDMIVSVMEADPILSTMIPYTPSEIAERQQTESAESPTWGDFLENFISGLRDLFPTSVAAVGITGSPFDSANGSNLTAGISLEKTPNQVFNEFRSGWRAAPRTVYADNRLSASPKALLGGFQSKWNGLDRSVNISNSLSESAGALFSRFQTAWNGTNRSVGITNNLTNSSHVLFSAFRASWNGSPRNVNVDNQLANSHTTLFRAFLSGWTSTAKTVEVKDQLARSANTLWTEFKTQWGTPSVGIRASVASQISVNDLISSRAATLAIQNSATKQKIGTFTVTRMARGGIISAETLFPGGVLAGEDGTEAIVPLERHTEWLDKVADQVARRMEAQQSSSGGDQPLIVQVTLDGRIVGQTAVNYIRREAKAGRDPIGAYI